MSDNIELLPTDDDEAGLLPLPGDEKPTHSRLVHRAVRWLHNTRKCAVTLWERTCHFSSEIPDAIGWEPDGWSILVECKATRGDFLKDKRKTHRQNEHSMGQERWYFTPPALVSVDELPAGWGLLELHGDRVRKKETPITFQNRASANTRAACRLLFDSRITQAESPLLVAALRRSTEQLVNQLRVDVRGVRVRSSPSSQLLSLTDLQKAYKAPRSYTT